jgi:CRISPR-associated protein Cas2
MSRDTMLRVLCHDVSSDRRRRSIARLLEDHASRVQLSVFEARLTSKALLRLVREVEAQLGEGDSLRVYTISATGERQSEVLGHGVPIEPGEAFWLM